MATIPGTVWNPDVLGHNGMLANVLKAAGLVAFLQKHIVAILKKKITMAFLGDNISCLNGTEVVQLVPMTPSLPLQLISQKRRNINLCRSRSSCGKIQRISNFYFLGWQQCTCGYCCPGKQNVC